MNSTKASTVVSTDKQRMAQLNEMLATYFGPPRNGDNLVDFVEEFSKPAVKLIESIEDPKNRANGYLQCYNRLNNEDVGMKIPRPYFDMAVLESANIPDPKHLATQLNHFVTILLSDYNDPAAAMGFIERMISCKQKVNSLRAFLEYRRRQAGGKEDESLIRECIAVILEIGALNEREQAWSLLLNEILQGREPDLFDHNDENSCSDRSAQIDKHLKLIRQELKKTYNVPEIPLTDKESKARNSSDGKLKRVKEIVKEAHSFINGGLSTEATMKLDEAMGLVETISGSKANGKALAEIALTYTDMGQFKVCLKLADLIQDMETQIECIASCVWLRVCWLKPKTFFPDMALIDFLPILELKLAIVPSLKTEAQQFKARQSLERAIVHACGKEAWVEDAA